MFARGNYCRFSVCLRQLYMYLLAVCKTGAETFLGQFHVRFQPWGMKKPKCDVKMNWHTHMSTQKAHINISNDLNQNENGPCYSPFQLSTDKKRAKSITLKHLLVEALVTQEKEKKKFQLSINSIRAFEIGLMRMKQCDRPKQVRCQVYPITAQQ